MKRILTPLLPGQRQLDLIQHISGGYTIKLGQEHCLLSPRQAYDFAVAIFKNMGIEVAELPARPDDLMGDVLKAKIKLVG